jgi:hypothetical protein
MPKFVLCDQAANHSDKPVWLNLDFVEQIVEGPDRIPDESQIPDSAPQKPSENIILHLYVRGDNAWYKIRNPDWIEAVKDFLVRSLNGNLV